MKTFNEYGDNLRREILLELSLTSLRMRSMLLSPRTERTVLADITYKRS
jgi:hypothetical protein